MPSHASHICPKCREARDQEAFRRKNGELAGWCSWCRDAHRSRLIKLRERKETREPSTWEERSAEAVAKAEGYAGHPLATLLALSHIVGAKRERGIRYGKKAWLGKQAWRAYNDAKRALDALLAPQHPVMTMKLPAGYTWRVYGGDPENPTYSPELTKLVNDQLTAQQMEEHDAGLYSHGMAMPCRISCPAYKQRDP